MKRSLLVLTVSALAVGLLLPATSGAVVCKLKGKKVKCPTAKLRGPAGPAGADGIQGAPGTPAAVGRFNLRAAFGTPSAGAFNSDGLQLATECATPVAGAFVSASPLQAVATGNNGSITVHADDQSVAQAGAGGYLPAGSNNLSEDSTEVFFTDANFDNGTSDKVRINPNSLTTGVNAGTIAYAGSNGAILTVDYSTTVQAGAPAGDCVVIGNIVKTG